MKRMLRFRLLIALSIMLVLLLMAGCAGKSNAPPGGGDAPGKNAPAAGALDNLVFVEGTDIVHLDTHKISDRPTQTVLGHIHEPLLQWKDTELSGYAPRLADSWKVSDDGKTWTFTLHSGIKFHDGSPFDATAVKFNLERVLDKAYASPNVNLIDPISTVAAPDPLTVVITTNFPFAALLENLTQIAIVSPDAVKKWGTDYNKHPVGTGPYKFKEWIPAQHVILERNEDYWGPKPNVKQITYQGIPEGAARVVALESGQADIVTRLPPESIESLKSNKNVEILTVPSTFQVSFEFNFNVKPMDNVKVRQAINHAIDRDAIVKKLLRGFGAVPEGPIPTGAQNALKLPKWEYSPEKAKQLLAEAGYPNGFPLELWSSVGRYSKDKEIAEAVVGYLQAIGIQATLKVHEWATYSQIYRDPKKPAGMYILGVSIPTTDWRLVRNFHSTSPGNVTGYKNPKVDELLDQARATFDETKRSELYAEAQKLIWNEAPYMFAYNQVQLIGVKKGIQGLKVYGFEVVYLGDVAKSK